MPQCLAQFCSAALLAFSLALGGGGAQAQSQQAQSQQAALPPVAAANEAVPNEAGVIAVPSAHGLAETVALLKKDIAAKGVMFFAEIDQGALAAKAGVAGVAPSVLLMFGNPPLGTQFLLANQQAGLDWPVRMLVYQDKASGKVMVAWTDFAWIARRHGIASQPAQFKMAAEVAGSIASAAMAR
ncbi:DUF302 domain-containing protein [Paracoccus pantotrophus]|uniref:DUF302 domain-containing protein n=1 Tax=Paracoccus pantotrophus TaxID=82367 RepID=UPI0035B0E704